MPRSEEGALAVEKEAYESLRLVFAHLGGPPSPVAVRLVALSSASGSILAWGGRGWHVGPLKNRGHSWDFELRRGIAVIRVELKASLPHTKVASMRVPGG
jgi:hypothetical protein